MQQGRVSTIRFNEWICVCAQYEKAVARIGRQVYQAYSRGLVEDFASSETCKEISQAFADSKNIRAELEEELERDALRGLSVEEAKKAEEVLQLSEGEKVWRKIKLAMTKLLGKQAVNRSLQGYRDRVRELSRDLGLRALALHDKEPVLKMESHLRLCQLAIKLDEDSNKKWDEIVAGKSESGGMNISFHHQLIAFIANFASFSRNTAFGKMMLKFVNYNPEEEEKKLTKQFEGTKTAAALEAQMSEIEEPDLDIGREMATMQREYEETPSDWGLPPRPAMESWVSDIASSWSPDFADEPSKPEPVAPPTAPVETSKPQVLRQRPSEPTNKGWTNSSSAALTEPLHSSWSSSPVSNEPSASPDWSSSDDPSESIGSDWAPSATPTEPEQWVPPAPVSARPEQPTPPADDVEEDWASEMLDDDVPMDDPSRPRLAGAPALTPPTNTNTMVEPPVQKPLTASTPTVTTPPPTAPAVRAPEPPTAPSQLASPSTPTLVSIEPPKPPQRPAAPKSIEDIPLPPLPPLPSRHLRSTESLTSGPPSRPTPATPPPAPAPAPMANDDPLLRLLKNEPIAPDPIDDDDLLPAFLRDRHDDSPDPSSFIPDLPDSVDLGLKILPFGGNRKKDDDEDNGSFIPQMPD